MTSWAGDEPMLPYQRPPSRRPVEGTRTICGRDKKVSALPWSRSDQYDHKLRIAGRNNGYDDIVLSGDPTSDRNRTCYYLRQGEPVAADSVNRPGDSMTTNGILGQVAVDTTALTPEVAV